MNAFVSVYSMYFRRLSTDTPELTSHTAVPTICSLIHPDWHVCRSTRRAKLCIYP